MLVNFKNGVLVGTAHTLSEGVL